MLKLKSFEGKSPRTVNGKFVYELVIASMELSPETLVAGITPQTATLKGGKACLIYTLGGIEYATLALKSEKALHYMTVVYWSSVELQADQDGLYTVDISLPKKVEGLLPLCDHILGHKSVSKVRIQREFIPQGLLQETIDTAKDLLARFDAVFVGQCSGYKA